MNTMPPSISVACTASVVLCALVLELYVFNACCSDGRRSASSERAHAMMEPSSDTALQRA